MESDLVVKYAKGCVFGAWCGDALGTFLENRLVTPEGVEAALEMNGGGAFNVGPGQFTDDSELSL
jgi:ADP-ribosylglycohydrolase